MLENLSCSHLFHCCSLVKNFGIWFHLAAKEAKKYKLNLLALCLLKGVLSYYYMRM